MKSRGSQEVSRIGGEGAQFTVWLCPGATQKMFKINPIDVEV